MDARLAVQGVGVPAEALMVDVTWAGSPDQAGYPPEQA